jgi:G:T-mismatch repair DNA endonuclease (very short patch repair protein)
MQRNAERDRRADQLARLAGYEVLRMWECDVTNDVGAAATAVLDRCLAQGAGRRQPPPIAGVVDP